jgi:hypothetical protein
MSTRAAGDLDGGLSVQKANLGFTGKGAKKYYRRRLVGSSDGRLEEDLRGWEKRRLTLHGVAWHD